LIIFNLLAAIIMDIQNFIKTNLELVVNFRETLNKETDRGCALMAASFLENELSLLLKEKFVGNNSQIEELFEFNGPLGTFSSKIKISYCIGLINKQSFKDLEIIRRVRNDFGHQFKPIEFTSENIKNRINNLTLHYYTKGEATPRQIFTNAVLGNLALIHGSLFKTAKFKEQDEVAFTEEMKQAAKRTKEDIIAKLFEEISKEDENDKPHAK
jgi:DNA-binding MltR family transcriptional regulator